MVESLASGRRIRTVRSARARAASQAMVVYALDREDAGGPRIAVVAGKAVGNAAQRNRAKRRLRAAARQALLPGVDMVIDARRAAVTAPFDTLSDDVVRLTSRAQARASA